MKVRFNGPEADVTAFGQTFEIGKTTDISDLPETHQAKLANNSTFSVVGKPKPEPEDPAPAA